MGLALSTTDELLKLMVDRQASDLHLAVGTPPTFRIDGQLIPHDSPPITHGLLRDMIVSVLEDPQLRRFEEDKELDFSHSVPGIGRFRGNAFLQQGMVGCVFRAIPEIPPTLDQLGFSNLKEFCTKPRGLVLVTGPTGCGKSTTLAAIIHEINTTQAVHIVTIEDPVEFLHKNIKSIIRQRQLGTDTLSFPNALKHVLRQDPDVILVGEMRDFETISLAITAAETGHLVFATLHTPGAAQTMDRIVDVFPPHQQQQVRIQLAGTLEGVISQTLLRRARGSGRVCAMELMIVTPAIRNLIREGRTQQIQSTLQTSAQQGMQTLDMALTHLVNQGLVTYEEAYSKAGSPDELRRILGR